MDKAIAVPSALVSQPIDFLKWGGR